MKYLTLLIAITLGVAFGASPRCPSNEDGYLCVEGHLNSYYECNSPWYVGWRNCPSGTICSDTSSIHAEVPCQEWASSSSSSSNNKNHGSESSNSNNTNGNEIEVTWSTWWLWVVVAAFSFCVLITGWIGSITWPGTHKRFALRCGGYCC